MEDILKHPIVILIALASVGISSLVNIKLASDPTARPDPFTGSQGAALELELKAELREQREEFRAHRRDFDNHLKWGRKVSVENGERLRELETQVKDMLPHHIKHHKGEEH